MNKQEHLRKFLFRLFFYWARLLHIYVSALLFSLLIFFCATGVFLNHPGLFTGAASEGAIEVQLPGTIAKYSALIEPDANTGSINLKPLERWLRMEHGLIKLSSIDYDLDMGEIIFNYSMPAGYASVVYLFEEARVMIDYREGDAVAIMNDLHKGRHSGVMWSWLLDLSAGFIIFFALTGYAIIFQNKKHRRRALIFSVIGLLSPVGFYFIFVPKIFGI